MANRTYYLQFKNWPAWQSTKVKCESFVRGSGYYGHITGYKRKLAEAEGRVKQLRALINEKCPHPLSSQYVETIKTSCDYDAFEDWTKYYRCELCGQTLGTSE